MSGPLRALPPLHLGDLHAYEQLLVLVLAFGPFVVLGVVVAVLRRRDLAAEPDPGAPEAPEAPEGAPGTAGQRER